MNETKDISSHKIPVYVAVGTKLTGHKEIIGIYLGNEDQNMKIIDEYRNIDIAEATSFWFVIFEDLKDRGIEIIPVTLHVGLGTFRPVNVEDTENHKMHSEYYEVSKDSADKLNKAIKSGKRIVAVGTTSVRTLESAIHDDGLFYPECKNTSIFIYPGYKFKAVNALITNFHLPKSTLIMLVSALAGKDNILNAYNEAVKEKYRFFSFGDAMFIH